MRNIARSPLSAVIGIMALATVGFGCSSSSDSTDETASVSSKQALGLSTTANLQVLVKTQACANNQVQNVFRVVNQGTTSVKISDIKIRYWVYDTATSQLVPETYYGGYVTSNGTTLRQVSAPTATAVQFSPACGGDATHQANWEITLKGTDNSLLAPGQVWDNLQTTVHTSTWSQFSPGSGYWHSGCGSSSTFEKTIRFGLYYQDELIYDGGIAAPSCRAPKGTQELSGQVPTAVTTATLVGPVPADKIVNLTFSLPTRNTAELKALVQSVSDPSSSSYRQYIDSGEFVSRFGAAPEDFSALTTWATDNDLTITNTFDQSLMLGVKGTAEAINKALYVNLNYYLRSDGSKFYAADREPSLDLAPALLQISNLDNYVQPKADSGTTEPNGSHTDERHTGAYLGNDLHAAFVGNATVNGKTIDGTGQRLGIFVQTYNGGYGLDANGNVVDYDGYQNLDITQLRSDFANYQSASGITPGTTLTLCNVEGGDGGCNPVYPTQPLVPEVPGSNVDAYTETALDVEMATAIAPGLSEIVVFEGGQTVDVLKTVALAEPKINQYSASYTHTYLNSRAIESVLLQLAAQGVSVFNSTGDHGPYQDAGTYQTEQGLDLAVTFVGGSELRLTDDQSAYSYESAWSDDKNVLPYWAGGAGVLLGNTLPSYQEGMSIANGSTEHRNLPDVSMPADDVVIYFNSIHGVTGGTSAATPLWAAFAALMNQANEEKGLPSQGFLNPLLYTVGRSSSYSSYFHDVTVGSIGRTTSNSNCSSDTSTCGLADGRCCSYAELVAATGYDLATGWGSPKTSLLVRSNTTVATTTSRTLAAGRWHSCAILSNGGVSCWGANDSGQLGNGSTAGSSVPTPTSATWGTGTVAAVVAGDRHSCALVSDSSSQTSVWCWGFNAFGELGNPVAGKSLVPVQVQFSDGSPLTGIKDIVAGTAHTCAIDSNDTAWCWGNNYSGQLGNGVTQAQTQHSAYPVQVMLNGSPLPSITSIAPGAQHTCAVSNDAVYCWGANAQLQLGNSTVAEGSYSFTPIAVDPMTRVVSSTGGAWEKFVLNGVISGNYHSCALFALAAWPTENEVWCWGDNSSGQVGGGLTDVETYRPSISGVCGPSIAAAAGGSQTCSILIPTQACGSDCPEYLSVNCWGNDTYGQLGDGGSDTVVSWPVEAVGTTDMTTVSVGGTHACAANSTGIYCWGNNDHGQVGVGSSVAKVTVPALVQSY